MKSLCRPLATGIFAILSLCGSAQIIAQQPTAVLGIRSVDSLLDDADFVGEKTGTPGIKQQAESFLEAFTGGRGLEGVDRTKPLGMYAEVGEEGPKPGPVIFIPISDQDAFLEVLKTLAPDLEENDGIMSMSLNGRPLQGVISDGYFFASPEEGALDELHNPAEIVNEDYDIALDINIADIPENLKSTFLTTVESEGRANLENSPQPATEAEAAGREFGFEKSLAVMKALVNEGETITIGIDVDAETGIATVDLGFTSLEGSELAGSMKAFSELTPLFAAAVPENSPLALVISHPTTGILKDLDQLFDQIQKSAESEIDEDINLQNDEARKVAQEAAAKLISIFKSTASSGELHSAVFMTMNEDNQVGFVAATHLEKTSDIQPLLEQLAAEQNQDGKERLKLNVDKYKGASIHEAIPAADFQDELLGSDNAHLAVTKNSVIGGIGHSNLSAVKSVLDSTSEEVDEETAPIYLFVQPARLITIFEKNDEALLERAGSIAGTDGDMLEISINPDELGATLHIEFSLDLVGLGGRGR